MFPCPNSMPLSLSPPCASRLCLPRAHGPCKPLYQPQPNLNPFFHSEIAEIDQVLGLRSDFMDGSPSSESKLEVYPDLSASTLYFFRNAPCPILPQQTHIGIRDLSSRLQRKARIRCIAIEPVCVFTLPAFGPSFLFSLSFHEFCGVFFFFIIDHMLSGTYGNSKTKVCLSPRLHLQHTYF